MAGVRPRHGSVLEALGGFLAKMQAALDGFDHPGAHRTLKWDLSRAAWIAEHLEVLGDAGRPLESTRGPRVTTKSNLLAVSRHLEAEASSSGSGRPTVELQATANTRDNISVK